MTQTVPQTTTGRRAGKASRRSRTVLFLQIGLAVVALVLWELLSLTFDLEFWMSRPSNIVLSLVDWAESGKLWSDTLTTLSEAGAGFLIGGAAGAVLGFGLGWIKLVGDVLEPFLIAFYTLPKVALAPLFLLWFGIGALNKIVFATVLVFFMVFFTTFEGARQIDKDLIENAAVLGAGRWQTLVKFVVPNAAIWVFTGLRLGLPYAMIGAVVGEFFAAVGGIGYFIKNASQLLDTASVFAGLAILATISLTGMWLLNIIETRALRWKRDPQALQIQIVE